MIVPLTFVTAEPFVGHFGIGGLPGGQELLRMFLKKEGIMTPTGVAFEEVSADRIRLTDGTGSRSARGHTALLPTGEPLPEPLPAGPATLF